MKKYLQKIMIAVLLCSLFTSCTQPVSAASAGTNITKALKYYKQKKYKKAQKYFNKVNKSANDACVKKMSKPMKKAYRKVVKKYVKNKNNFAEYFSAGSVWGYYLTDIDNDKKADLMIRYGSCEGDVRTILFQYKSGKAKKVAVIGSGHTCYHAYPGHKGILECRSHMGYEDIGVLTIKNGKLKSKHIGGRATSEVYTEIPCALDDHVHYDKDLNCSYDYEALK